MLIFTVVSVIFFSSEESGYFATFSSDSLRYVKEINFFLNDIYDVNELEGTFGDYLVTPKMGMPSLLSWIILPYGVAPKIVYYVLNNFTVLVFLFIANSFLYQIVFLFTVKKSIYYMAAIVIFLIPADFYWLLRFLRESGANAIFLNLLLLTFLIQLRPQRRYVFYYTFFALLLLFYRPQLLVISCGYFLFITFIINRSVSLNLLLLMLGLLAVLQSIRSMGGDILLQIFEAVGISFADELLILIKVIDRNIVIGICCFLTVIYSIFSNKNKVISFSKSVFFFFSAALLFVLILLAVFMLHGVVQIRLIYPVVYFIKIIFLTFVIITMYKNDFSTNT